MRHQRQPTATSCGPACVAMVAGVSVGDAMVWTKGSRLSRSRRRLKTDHASVGEMRRALEFYGYTMGRRARGSGDMPRLALLRIGHTAGHGWHWAVKDGLWFRDPWLPRREGLFPALRRCAGYGRLVLRAGEEEAMSAVLDGHTLGAALARHGFLPQGCRSAEIRIEPDGLVVMHCEIIIEGVMLAALAKGAAAAACGDETAQAVGVAMQLAGKGE